MTNRTVMNETETFVVTRYADAVNQVGKTVSWYNNERRH